MTRKVWMGAALALLWGGSALADRDDERREHEEHEAREHGWRRGDDDDWRRHHHWRFRLEEDRPNYYYNQQPGYDPYYNRYQVPEDSDRPQDSD